MFCIWSMYWIYTNKIFLYISPGDSMDKIGRISRICKFSIWWISRIYKEKIFYISLQGIVWRESRESRKSRKSRESRRFKTFTPWKIWRIEKHETNNPKRSPEFFEPFERFKAWYTFQTFEYLQHSKIWIFRLCRFSRVGCLVELSREKYIFRIGRIGRPIRNIWNWSETIGGIRKTRIFRMVRGLEREPRNQDNAEY